MNAAELRINNLVEISNEEFHKDATGLLMIVTGIRAEESEYFPESKHSVSLLHGHFTYSQMEEFITPIPLTEEWLLKFGFRENIKYDNTYYLHFETLNGWHILDIDIRACVLMFDEIEINIKYVHQLQNLFFALTGQELTLKK